MTESTHDLFAKHVERVRDSDLFRRTDTLRRLFDFLVARSLADKPPKEIEIAIDVFGKDSSFEAEQSATVRVSVHKLRRKLDEFYAQFPNVDGRLTVPLGSYRVIFEPAASVAAVDDPSRAVEVAAETNIETRAVEPSSPRWIMHWLPVALAVLLIANVGVYVWRVYSEPASLKNLSQVRNHPLWSSIRNDTLPVSIVVGDYYIFAELDDTATEPSRLVRDFNINSRNDLERFLKNNPELAGRYMDVSLKYLPTSIATALQKLIPVLEPSAKPRDQVQIMLASELTPEIIKSTHVIYIGLLSGMGAMGDAAFGGSRFAVGDSYDELIDKTTHQHYMSGAPGAMDSGAAGATGKPGHYRDYAYFSTLTLPSGNHILILAGTRDVALLHIVDALTQHRTLTELTKRSGTNQGFEALYAVDALGRTNLEGHLLVASRVMPPSALNADASSSSAR